MNEAINLLPTYTPAYIVDEVQCYFNKINIGKNDCFTLDNAIALVNMAKINKGINHEQAQNIKEIIRNIKNN